MVNLSINTTLMYKYVIYANYFFSLDDLQISAFRQSASLSPALQISRDI